MSIRISLSSEIVTKNKNTFRKDLTIIPKLNIAIKAKNSCRYIWRKEEENGEKFLNIPMNYGIKKFNLERNDIIHQVPKYNIKTKLRDYQVEVKKETIKALNEQGSVILNLHTGWGKTIIGAYLSWLINKKQGASCIIITPAVSLIKEAWVTVFNSRTEGCKVFSDFSKKNVEKNLDDSYNVYICMKTELSKLSNDLVKKIGLVIIDEAHMLCSEQSVEQILRFTPKYIILLTATFERDDGNHKVMNLIGGDHMITRKNSKKFYLIKVPTKFTPKDFEYNPHTGFIQWNTVQRKFDEMEDRLEMILNFYEYNKDKKFLYLTAHKDHAIKITNKFIERGHDAVCIVGGTKKYKDSDILVGTFSKLSTGFDEENACDNWKGKRVEVLVLDASTKQIAQKAGRVFRASTPHVIFPVDNFKNNKSHFSVCRKWFMDESHNCVEYVHADYTKPLILNEIEKIVEE